MSDLLLDALETMSDEQLVLIYEDFKRKEEYRAAFKFRTRFIQHRYYRGEREWSREKAYMVSEEASDLTSRRHVVAQLMIERENHYLTHISPFLMAKSVRLGYSDFDITDIIKLNTNQLTYIEVSSIQHIFANACLCLYYGVDMGMYKGLIQRSAIRHEELRKLPTRDKHDLSVSDIETAVEERYRKVKDRWDVKQSHFEPVREQLRTLFAYNWSKGKMESAGYFLMKVMRITDSNEPIYQALEFLSKELFNNQPVYI